MTELPFRTNASSLTHSELTLLDILFDCRCEFRLLRDSVFKPQWNLPYSHNLDDVALRETLSSLCQRGILAADEDDSPHMFGMTAHGGEIWSSERCPKWDRFCMQRYTTTIRGRTMMTVIAVSSSVRNDFLRYWPMYPARKRKTTVSDFGLVPWHPFGTLHVGVATYKEQREWTFDEYKVYIEQYELHQTQLDANRSWWRFVGELQQFVDEDA